MTFKKYLLTAPLFFATAILWAQSQGVNPAELGAGLLDHHPEIIARRDVRLRYKRATAKATQFRCGALGVHPIQLGADLESLALVLLQPSARLGRGGLCSEGHACG